jgi:hypothetical protein
MTDAEKLRAKGLDEQSIIIWTNVQEYRKKLEGCILHLFEQLESPYKFKCKNCGCVEDGGFVLAYEQGIEHGKNFKAVN